MTDLYQNEMHTIVFEWIILMCIYPAVIEHNRSDIMIHGPSKILITAVESTKSRPSTIKLAIMDKSSISDVLNRRTEYSCSYSDDHGRGNRTYLY